MKVADMTTPITDTTMTSNNDVIHPNSQDFPQGTRLQVKLWIDESGYGTTVHDVIVSEWTDDGLVRLSYERRTLTISNPVYVSVIKIYNPFALNGAGAWYTPRRPDERSSVFHPDPRIFLTGTTMRVTIDDNFFYGVDLIVKILGWTTEGGVVMVEMIRVFDPPLLSDDGETDTFKFTSDKVRVVEVLCNAGVKEDEKWIPASQYIGAFKPYSRVSPDKSIEHPHESQFLPHQLEFMKLITELKARGDLLGYDVKVSF